MVTVLESIIKALQTERLLSNQRNLSIRTMIQDGYKRQKDLQKRINEACLNDKSHVERLSQ